LRSAADLVLIRVRAGRRRPAGLMGAVIFATAACLTGCSGAPAAGGGISVDVTPMTSVADQPVSIRISGLTPGTIVSLRLRSTDSNGVPWSSSAAFRASSAGSIDPAQSAALSGSYTGVSPMGLFWSMRPDRRAAAGAYFWSPRPLSFEITAAALGHSPVSVRLSRTLSRTALVVRRESLRTAGFYGEFFSAASAPERRPALLVLGGSEGGLSGTLVAALLAAHGYPALALAYFNAPGLPAQLLDIPLEYFARALRWLRAQPQVDPGQVLTLGVSRGSEAALLLGAYYPRLVDGVIASVPSDVAICSYPDCNGPAWTLHGRPLPYTFQFDNPHPADDSAAVIPVERIHGPVFLDCGGADAVWVSCPYARAIMTRLAAHHDPYQHVLEAYPAAGHGVGSLVPYQPIEGTATLGADLSGRSPGANPDADAKLWPRLLEFLASVTKGQRL
jgi:dienelactone hydrolase